MRAAAKHPTVYRRASATRNYAAQMSSAEGEKPFLACLFPELMSQLFLYPASMYFLQGGQRQLKDKVIFLWVSSCLVHHSEQKLGIGKESENDYYFVF